MLGEAEGADLLTVGDGSQELLLDLLRGGGVHDAAAVEGGIHGEGDAEGGVHLGDLLHSQDVAQVAASQTTHLGGIGETVNAGLTKLPERLQGELAALVPLQDAGEKILLCKLSGKLLDLLLVLCEGKVHGRHILSFDHG